MVDPEGLIRLGPQDYDEYLEHQADKLQYEEMTSYEPTYQLDLGERLRKVALVYPGMNVLCLGARLGAEVRAFIDQGCFAVGLDLNPGEGNRHVVHGDFHQIQYASGSVDAVFTNSLDHVFDLGGFIGEVCRVLKADGFLIMDVVKGSIEGVQPGNYESLWWERIDDILTPFLAGPFELVCRHDIAWPWDGEHIVLKRRKGMSQKAMTGNIIAEAMAIPGRCLAPELIFLNQLAMVAPPGLPMVELGTFQGRTAAVICAAARQIGSDVVTIDNYAQDPAFTTWPKGYEEDPECGKEPEEYAELTRQNLARLGFRPQIVIGDTATVPDGIEEVGFLFIDSEHTPEKFKEECDAWLPLMGPGSVLACHDYRQPTWPKMTPAIDERITPDEWENLGLVIWLVGFKRK